jgi:hypothetical protein
VRHGRLPPKLFIFYLYIRNFGGYPPVPPITFLHFLFLNNNHNINIIYKNNSNLIKMF